MGVALSVIALYRILHQLGPFSLGAALRVAAVVQSLVAIISLLMLSVAAEVNMRRRVEGETRLLNETLERRVTERTSELTRVHDRLVEAQAVAQFGSWEWDVAADSLWWSDELCRIFGVTKAPVSYQAFRALVHPDDRERTDTEVNRAITSNLPFSIEHRIVRSDGGIRVLHGRGRVELDAAGRPIRLVGTGHDITERREAEEERAQLIREQTKLREAEAANRAKDAFLATLSHELRTPLNAALGWAHILRDTQRGEGRESRAVQAIYRNLMIQSRLVSDILDISRIAKGELPLEPELVDMTPVFEAALDMVREAAATKDVRIDIRTVGSPTVTGDARRLQQVAWNLLSNAVKFAADRGRVTVSILETARSSGVLSGRRWPGYRTGVPATCVRTVQPGGFVGHARARRPRSWPGHRATHHRVSPRYDRRRESEVRRRRVRGPAASTRNDETNRYTIRRISHPRRSLVILRRLLQLHVRGEVVLNPQLRLVLREKLLDVASRRARLLLVELERRQAVHGPLLRIVIQIAGQHDAAGLRQLHVQHLMPGRVARRALEDHRAVAEHVVLVGGRGRRVLLFFSAL